MDAKEWGKIFPDTGERYDPKIAVAWHGFRPRSVAFRQLFQVEKRRHASPRADQRSLAHFSPATSLTTHGKAADPFTVITTPQFGDREMTTLFWSTIDSAHWTSHHYPRGDR